MAIPCLDIRTLEYVATYIEVCVFMHVRSMDKYARLMQKLEIVNVEFFKVCFYLLVKFLVSLS